MLEIYDSFGAAAIKAEENNEPSMTMLAGYIPDDLRIKELLLAGERLEAFKYGYEPLKSDFDFSEREEVPDDYDSYDEYMDELEAQDLLNQSNQRIAESIKAREELYSRRIREENELKKSTSQVVENKQEETKEGE